MDKKEQQLNKLLKENASLPAPDADKILLAARVKMAEKEKTRKPVSKYSKIVGRIAAIGAACLVIAVTLIIVFNQIGFIGGNKNEQPGSSSPETAYSYYKAYTLKVSETSTAELQSRNLTIATLNEYITQDFYLYTFSASGEAAMVEAKYRVLAKDGSISEVVIVTDFGAHRAHERYSGLNKLGSIKFNDYALNAEKDYYEGEYTARAVYLDSSKTYILDIKNPNDFDYNYYLELFFKNL